MSGARVVTLAREDLRLTLRDRSSIFWIFIAPFLWVLLFGSLNRPSDPGRSRISLGVILGEESPLALRFVEGLKAENFEVKVAATGEGLGSGRTAPGRVLEIPARFQESIQKREKVELTLRESPNANPEGTFAAEVALHKATIRLLGGLALEGFTPDRDAVTVRGSWAVERAAPSGYYQTIPGNLVMFVLIATFTYGSAQLAGERRSGLLRRMAGSPLTRGEIVTGKVAGRVALALVQVLVFIVMSLTAFRISWGESPVGLALLLGSFVLCAACCSMLGGALFRSAEAASGIGLVLVLLMSALGGCWWPTEVMPGWMQTVAYAFPTAWAMNGLHELISWGGGLADVAAHCLVLASVALAAGLGAAYRLRSVV